MYLVTDNNNWVYGTFESKTDALKFCIKNSPFGGDSWKLKFNIDKVM